MIQSSVRSSVFSLAARRYLQWQSLMPLLEATLRILSPLPSNVPSDNLAKRSVETGFTHMRGFETSSLCIGGNAAILAPLLNRAPAACIANLHVSMYP